MFIIAQACVTISRFVQNLTGPQEKVVRELDDQMPCLEYLNLPVAVALAVVLVDVVGVGVEADVVDDACCCCFC